MGILIKFLKPVVKRLARWELCWNLRLTKALEKEIYIIEVYQLIKVQGKTC